VCTKKINFFPEFHVMNEGRPLPTARSLANFFMAAGPQVGSQSRNYFRVDDVKSVSKHVITPITPHSVTPRRGSNHFGHCLLIIKLHRTCGEMSGSMWGRRKPFGGRSRTVMKRILKIDFTALLISVIVNSM